MSDSPASCVDEGNSLRQNMEEATRCTIISLYTRLNGMVARSDLTLSLMVWTKRSIKGICYFLYAKFRFIPREVLYLRIGLNLLSVSICVILNPRFGYNLCIYVIPSAILLFFGF